MQRKPRAEVLGLDVGSAPPPKKKMRVVFHGVEAAPQMDHASYERHLKQLEKEESKSVKNRTAIRVLMRETSMNRRKWITEDRPAVRDVIRTFPSLKEYEYVS